jgi:large subunit ribosomal protein L15
MQLHNLKPAPGSRPAKHIVGRGEGSGLGQTAGKGQKGQSSRSGDTIMMGFEGGQTPLFRRIPKRGFTFTPKPKYEVVGLESLNVFAKGTEVNPETLRTARLARKKDQPIKILGNGELKHALVIKAHAFSKSALEKIKTAGGQAQAIAV